MQTKSDQVKSNINESSSSMEIMKEACKKIAPLWPLENFVAVNPFMGFSNRKFSETAAELQAISDIQLTMPAEYYLERIEQGKIAAEDLNAALSTYGFNGNVDQFLEQVKVQESTKTSQTVYAIVDVASALTETDWQSFMTTRIASWSASYHDQGQSFWKASFHREGIFNSWKLEAAIDRTPDYHELENFRKEIKALPDKLDEAVEHALLTFGITDEEELLVYFHRLLRIMGGWSAYHAYLDWQVKLKGNEGDNLLQFLSVLICWEACFLKSIKNPVIKTKWVHNIKTSSFSKTGVPGLSQRLTHTLILQEALDKAAQRELVAKFKRKEKASKTSTEIKAQAIFCIDVRSEVFRRNLENVDPKIETLGFAGFFGFPVNFLSIGRKKAQAQYPALIKPDIMVRESLMTEEADRKAGVMRNMAIQFKNIWSSFKQGAVSCFGFVSPLGLSFLPKLFTDTFGLTRPVPHPFNYGLDENQINGRTVSLETEMIEQVAYGLSIEERVELAKNALTAMSMTDNFARYILFVGHGSTSVNNPHATGLDCGACGGHSGEPNAKVAAAILNDKAVRAGLKNHQINIPDETVFLACLHDTTTDEITIFNQDQVPEDRKDDLIDMTLSFEIAGQLSRSERALKMPGTNLKEVDRAVKRRSTDWSQVRPEWGLAGCSAFIIANRSRTRDLNLEGKSFLHSYDWKKDQGFKVLEQIMTAPMVVTSWINLQYYASAVDNKNFGAGNKTLHNVTAGLGVIEGANGDLRTGLPWQSVHDGANLQHEPKRLTVVIEAPAEAINGVLKKHESIRELCDNNWISLMCLDDKGEIREHYVGDLKWESNTYA